MSTWMRGRGPRRADSGAVAVEFALILPVLVMVVFGAIGFGIAFAQDLALGSAVRDGARYGSVNLFVVTGDDRTCADVVAQTRDNANTIAMDQAQVEVVVKRGTSLGSATVRCSAVAGGAASGSHTTVKPCDGASGTDNLYVTTRYATEIMIPLVPLDPITLESTGAYRCEYDS